MSDVVCAGVARSTLICAGDVFVCIKLAVNIPHFLQGGIGCVLEHTFAGRFKSFGRSHYIYSIFFYRKPFEFCLLLLFAP